MTRRLCSLLVRLPVLQRRARPGAGRQRFTPGAPPSAARSRVPIRASVSVVICAYSDRRLRLLSETIESVRAQTPTPDEIVLVVDHNPGLAGGAPAAAPGGR